MKLSELINKMQKCMAEHGDVEVAISMFNTQDYEDIRDAFYDDEDEMFVINR